MLNLLKSKLAMYHFHPQECFFYLWLYELVLSFVLSFHTTVAFCEEVFTEASAVVDP